MSYPADAKQWCPTRSKQHVWEAISHLAQSSAPLQKRLVGALEYGLATLQTWEIPPYDGSREKFDEVKRQILAFRDSQASFDDEQAEAAAEMIVGIYQTIQVHAPGP